MVINNNLVDITTLEIENSFQKIISILNNKIFIFNNKYWKYIYFDRFFKTLIGITTMISVMILSFDVIPFKSGNNHVSDDMISIYIIYVLLIINLICVIIMSILKIRVKCVYYNNILTLYSNRLAVLKKKLSNPMNPSQFHHLYEKMMIQLNTIEQYENSSKIV